LWHLSIRVTSVINGIENVASQRNLDVWSLGNTMQAKADSNPVQLQSKVSDFLEHYLEKFSGTSTNERFDEVASGETGMIADFLNVSSPMQTCPLYESENKEAANRLRNILVADATNLLQDPEIIDILTLLEKGWISFFRKLPQSTTECIEGVEEDFREQLPAVKAIGVDSEPNDVLSEIRRSRVKLRALYASKILHGLGTPALNSHRALRSSVYWARHQNVHFRDIYDNLCEFLTLNE